MTEEPTIPAPDSPDYQIYQVYADSQGVKDIALAMTYVGETDADTFIAKCLKDYFQLIKTAYEGANGQNTLSFKSEYVQAAMAYGESQQQKARTEVPRPTLRTINGGKV